MTIPDLMVTLLVGATVYYMWFILRAYGGLRAPDGTVLGDDVPTISVVIAARNEEQSLGGCLEKLAQQDYPSDKLEFLIVDDGSTDKTADIVRMHRRADLRFVLLQLEKQKVLRPSRKRGRKPEALAAGIQRARGSIIAITDADCLPSAGWLRSLTSGIRGEVVYAVGPVVESDAPSFFSSIRSLEILGLSGMAGGLIGRGRPFNSLGANLAFKKSVYESTGGFDYAAVKSDEETLMHRIMSSDLGRIIFVASRDARIETRSPQGISSFWNQRKRWGAMHGRFFDISILIQLAVLYLSMLVPLIVLLGLPFWSSLWPWALGFFGSKAIVDFVMLRKCAALFGKQFSVLPFIVGEFLHTPYLVFVSTVAQILPYTWKDRKVLTVDPSPDS